MEFKIKHDVYLWFDVHILNNNIICNRYLLKSIFDILDLKSIILLHLRLTATRKVGVSD